MTPPTLVNTVLQSLHDIAEAILGAAVQQAPTPSLKITENAKLLRKYSQRLSYEHVASVAQAMLCESGFISVRVRHEPNEPSVTISALHQCGAWAATTVPDQFFHIATNPVLLLERINGMGCYCVRREP